MTGNETNETTKRPVESSDFQILCSRTTEKPKLFLPSGKENYQLRLSITGKREDLDQIEAAYYYLPLYFKPPIVGSAEMSDFHILLWAYSDFKVLAKIETRDGRILRCWGDVTIKP